MSDNLQKLQEQFSKEAEDERIRHELMVVCFEESPDGMVVAFADGLIALVNRQAEFLFGYHRSEMLGQPVEMLIPESKRTAHRSHRGGYIRDPRPRSMGENMLLSGRHKDGSEFPVEISLSPVSTIRGMAVVTTMRRPRAAVIPKLAEHGR